MEADASSDIFIFRVTSLGNGRLSRMITLLPALGIRLESLPRSMWHKGALVVLVFALAVLASARRLKAPALDKYYINRANEFHKQWAKEEGVVTLESGLQYKVLEKSQNTNPVHPTPAYAPPCIAPLNPAHLF